VRCSDRSETVELAAPAGARSLHYDEAGRFLCADGPKGRQCTFTWFSKHTVDWKPLSAFEFPVPIDDDSIVTGDVYEGCVADAGDVVCWRALEDMPLEIHRIELGRLLEDVVWLSSDAIDAAGCAVGDTGAVACWLSGGVAFSHPGPAVGALVRSGPGLEFACVLDAGGAVQCRGRGEWGQANSRDWKAVEGLPPVVELAASPFHLCGRTSGDDVYCWGKNDHGESTGKQPEFWEPLMPVEGLPPIAQLAARGNRTCAEDRSGDAWCWGSAGDSREPGKISHSGRVVPVEAYTPRRCDGIRSCMPPSGPPFEPLPEVEWPQVVTRVRGRTHECGLTSAGVVLCHGYNGFGQLGRPDAELVAKPVRVAVP
jgi:hypothetical protein